MHSTLQLELRASREAVKYSCRRRSHRHHTTERSFHQGSRLQRTAPGANDDGTPGPHPVRGGQVNGSVKDDLLKRLEALHKGRAAELAQNETKPAAGSAGDETEKEFHERMARVFSAARSEDSEGRPSQQDKARDHNDQDSGTVSSSQPSTVAQSGRYNPAEKGQTPTAGILSELLHNAGLTNVAEDIAASQQPAQSNATTEGGSEDPGVSENTIFYGSSAKRRLRSRAAKDSSNAPPSVALKWFTNNNVRLWGEEDLHLETRSNMQTVDWDSKRGGYVGKKEYEKINVEASPESAQREFTYSPVDRQTQVDEVPSTLESRSVIDSGSVLRDTSANDASTKGGDSSFRVVHQPVPKPGKRYFLERMQFQELTYTAGGLLQLKSAAGSPSELATRKTHLILHYAGTNGELFLETLVRQVAIALSSDLMSIDVQDIASLVSNGHGDDYIRDEGRLLSYEVYNDIYNKDTSSSDGHFNIGLDDASEEMEDAEESRSGAPRGMPIIFGKPVTIDLKNIMNGRIANSRSDRPMPPENLMSAMFGQPGPKSRSQPHMFTGLVESIVGLQQERRQMIGDQFAEKKEQYRSTAPRIANLPKDPMIIHVKDLRAIQDTPVGKQFLSELYNLVERKRLNGQAIMIIGTECAADDQVPYNRQRIEEMQRDDVEDISRTIVLTPAFPNKESELALLQDRERRIATINLRHLWETMRIKSKSFMDDLGDGFWTRNFLTEIHPLDRLTLGSSLWSFSHVQRLAAILTHLDVVTVDKAGQKFPPIHLATVRIEQSEYTKLRWAEQAQSRSEKKDLVVSPEHEDDARLTRIRAKATKHEKRLMSGVIQSRNISTTFNDVHVPVETIDALQTLTTLSLIRPEAFKYGVLASDKIPGLLLYGPPGTGKTLCAKAVAKESGATMLEVSAADLNDMYVGEGEKNVKALFGLAKKLSPCVVFLDEADAMFSARSHSGRRVSHRELLNQFLKEWDGMSNDSGSAFIMVATNRPMDLDDAVLRRLPRRLLVDLPTETDRLEILKIHLRNEVLADDVDLPKISKQTPFYSGSDLKNVAVAAALACVRAENEASKVYKGEEPFQYPEKRTLTAEHFDTALDEISASISEDMSSLREIKKFDEQFGDKRGRRKKAPKWGFRTAAEADEVLDTVKVRS